MDFFLPHNFFEFFLASLLFFFYNLTNNLICVDDACGRKRKLTEGATLSGVGRRYRMRTHSGESQSGAEGVRKKFPISQAKGQRMSKVFS